MTSMSSTDSTLGLSGWGDESAGNGISWPSDNVAPAQSTASTRTVFVSSIVSVVATSVVAFLIAVVFNVDSSPDAQPAASRTVELMKPEEEGVLVSASGRTKATWPPGTVDE